MQNSVTLIVLFGILLGMPVIYVFSRKERIETHRFLLFFFISLLLVQAYSFLVRSGLMMESLHLMNSNVPLIFLFGPFLLLYTRKLLGKNENRYLKLLHFLPFVFYLGYSFNFFLQSLDYKRYAYLKLIGLEYTGGQIVQRFDSDPWGVQGWVVVELLSLHLIVYSLWAIVQVYRHRTEISESRLKWASFVNLVLFMGGTVLLLSEGGVINGKVYYESPLSNISGDLFSTIALYLTTFYILSRPSFLFEKNKKYQRSVLSPDYKASKLRLIRNTMEGEKLYLNQDFSLELLSVSTGLSKHHISQIINEELKCSFFEYTHQFRIEEAKRLMQSTDFVKIEALAYDLGYRSKSSFFNAFKRNTNQTPSEYLKMHRK